MVVGVLAEHQHQHLQPVVTVYAAPVKRVPIARQIVVPAVVMAVAAPEKPAPIVQRIAAAVRPHAVMALVARAKTAVIVPATAGHVLIPHILPHRRVVQLHFAEMDHVVREKTVRIVLQIVAIVRQIPRHLLPHRMSGSVRHLRLQHPHLHVLRVRPAAERLHGHGVRLRMPQNMN